MRIMQFTMLAFGERHKQVAQLSYRREIALQDGSVIAKKYKTIFCSHYRSIFNHCDVIDIQSYRIRWINAK